MPTESEDVPVSDKVLEVLAGISTATLTTQLIHRGFRNTFLTGVRPLNPTAGPFAGPAFTLRYIPSREDIAVPEVWKNREYPQRKAIEIAPAGSVLIVDSHGDMRAGAAGDILVLRLRERGVKAFITDGAMRDTPAFSAMDFPVYCAGAAAPPSIVTLFAVALQVPIGCAGVAVFPGDIIVGDGEGAVVVPKHVAADIACDGAEQERFERFVHAQIKAGQPTFGLYPPNEETLAAYARWTED